MIKMGFYLESSLRQKEGFAFNEIDRNLMALFNKVANEAIEAKHFAKANEDGIAFLFKTKE